jgi:hypothetical protein
MSIKNVSRKSQLMMYSCYTHVHQNGACKRDNKINGCRAQTIQSPPRESLLTCYTSFFNGFKEYFKGEQSIPAKA